MQTQENMSEPRPEHQTLIELNGKEVWIDNDMVGLVKELNKLGLITRSHCAGHDSNNAWIIIRTDNITGIEIRNDPPYKEVVIAWTKPEEA